MVWLHIEVHSVIKTQKSRPSFPSFDAEATTMYLSDIINVDDLKEVFHLSGFIKHSHLMFSDNQAEQVLVEQIQRLAISEWGLTPSKNEKNPFSSINFERFTYYMKQNFPHYKGSNSFSDVEDLLVRSLDFVRKGYPFEKIKNQRYGFGFDSEFNKVATKNPSQTRVGKKIKIATSIQFVPKHLSVDPTLQLVPIGYYSVDDFNSFIQMNTSFFEVVCEYKTWRGARLYDWFIQNQTSLFQQLNEIFLISGGKKFKIPSTEIYNYL